MAPTPIPQPWLLVCYNDILTEAYFNTQHTWRLATSVPAAVREIKLKWNIYVKYASRKEFLTQDMFNKT
jgi:hypothetical protein